MSQSEFRRPTPRSLGLDDHAPARGLPAFPVVLGGEDLSVQHRLRQGHRYPIPLPSRRCDVVVVGAGLSGLTAAHALKDADTLVLERDARPGGHAMRGTWRDVTYGEGVAYVSEPPDYVEQLLEDLGVQLQELPPPADGYWVGGCTVRQFWERGADALPFSPEARQAFRRFYQDMSEVEHLPPLPVEEATASDLVLDRRPFSAIVKPYGPEVMRYMDLYCRAAMGGPLEAISAYWGLNFFAGEYVKRYTAPGGMAVLAEALAASVGPERILTGAAVIRVAAHGDKVHVTYVLGSEVVTIEARAVVMAIAKHQAYRVVEGLPADQAAAMRRMRYESYMVANVLVEGEVPRECYDTWVADAPFVDVVVADWTDPAAPGRRHGVLTAYCPLPDAFRSRMWAEAGARAMAYDVVEALDRMYPGIADRVVEVRTYRRDRPMVCSILGALSEIRGPATRPFGPVFFANTDSQMNASVESAVWEGQQAAMRVQAVLLGSAAA